VRFGQPESWIQTKIMTILTKARERIEVWPIVESKQLSNTMDQDTVQSFLKPCMNEEKSELLEEKSELLTKVAVSDNNHAFFLQREQNYPTLFSIC